MNYSPWPPEGKRIRVTLRDAYAMRVSYAGEWPPWAWNKRFKATWGRWPFLTMRIGRYGFYIGWKPINLRDPKFDVDTVFLRDNPACEFGLRVSNGL